VAVVLAWRKVTSGPGADLTGLFIASACGTAGLVLLAVWLQDQGPVTLPGRSM
jgi:hypothetical protein